MKEYALIRFTTRTGRVVEMITGQVAPMLKIMALNRATRSTSAVVVDLENGVVVYGVYGMSKVRDGKLGFIDDLGIPLDDLRKTLAD